MKRRGVSYPSSDVSSCNGICWSREATASTRKLIPVRTVRSGYTMADRAFLRGKGIGKIHKDQRYASYGCLVGHELSKLSEAPGCTVTPLRLRSVTQKLSYISQGLL